MGKSTKKNKNKNKNKKQNLITKKPKLKTPIIN